MPPLEGRFVWFGEGGITWTHPVSSPFGPPSLRSGVQNRLSCRFCRTLYQSLRDCECSHPRFNLISLLILRSNY